MESKTFYMEVYNKNRLLVDMELKIENIGIINIPIDKISDKLREIAKIIEKSAE